MSRTRRKMPISQYFRNPKTKGIRTAEHYAALEMEAAGFDPRPRLSARSNPKSGKIPSDWTDLGVAARRETDHG